jgi:hypothetical protein
MPTSNTTTSTALTTSHALDSRLLSPITAETTPKFGYIFKYLLEIYLFRKSPVRQSYLFGSNAKQRGDGEGSNMNMSTSPTSPLLPSSPPAVLSTTTADTNELMKKIDYFIRVKINFEMKIICLLFFD